MRLLSSQRIPNYYCPTHVEMTKCQMNSGYDTLKKPRFAIQGTLYFTDLRRYAIEVRHYEVLSINRIHEVFGHFVLVHLNNIAPRSKTHNGIFPCFL